MVRSSNLEIGESSDRGRPDRPRGDPFENAGAEDRAEAEMVEVYVAVVAPAGRVRTDSLDQSGIEVRVVEVADWLRCRRPIHPASAYLRRQQGHSLPLPFTNA